MIDDPEILFAAELGATLARMRRDLDEAAVKRVMTFVLSRYGIHPLGGGLVIQEYAAPAPAKAPAVAPPEEPEELEEPRRPAARVDCPICDYHTITDRGLNLHMYHKHGTTLKEYRRQKARDLPELEL